uniref:NADH dehydrogenase subunit 1 n=1 Tax=Plator insolens TaxID=2880587 RepID=UPI001F14158E|nr:NADH dehydrogenase subunit 1 [Plator insolens]UMI39155.1 NADH dehydrogenase subunit 1 [Plator insolens]
MNFLISTILILISVAFYTILERKILGYMQTRKGPNKVSIMGILQPLSDALKLFNKMLIPTEMMNYSLSYLTPALSLFTSMMMISIIPFNLFSSFDIKHSILMFFVISSLSVYFILMIGWSANSKFSFLGSIRGVAQMISYEVSFFLILLFMVILSHSYSFTEISKSQTFLYFIYGNSILFLIWTTSCLAETNRSPFDFAEGESELVSGFNVEYMGGWFALIFLAEYLNMLILSIMSIILFMKSLNSPMSSLMMIMMTIILLWIRGTLPRFRYDMLMNLSWKIFLPISLFLIPIPMIISLLSS